MNTGRRIRLLWAGSVACLFALFRPASCSRNTARPRLYPGHLPAIACVLFVAVFSARVASAGTLMYWIQSDSCFNACYGNHCIIPKGQLYESPSLNNIFDIVGGWTTAFGRIAYAEKLHMFDPPYPPYPYGWKWLQTYPPDDPQCAVVSGRVSCTVSSPHWQAINGLGTTPFGGPGAFVICPLGQYTTGQCSIRLSGPGGTNGALADVEPGKVVSGLRAEVTCDGAPSDKAVTLTAEAGANTGGHGHHDSARPPGALNPASGNSPVTFSFTAPAPAGDHTITAKCVDGSCGEDTGKVWVGVKDLRDIPDGPYTLTGSDGNSVGWTPTHRSNHYLNPSAAAKLRELGYWYSTVAFPFNARLQVNDASLERGGIFDINNNWKRPHAEHCRGAVVDIRANGGDGALNIRSDSDPMIEEIKSLAGGRGIDRRTTAGSTARRCWQCWCCRWAGRTSR